MEITEIISPNNIVAFDYDECNNLIIIDSDNRIFRNTFEIKIDLFVDFQSPRIKFFDQDKFLIADLDSNELVANCWIFTNTGELLNNFFIDDFSNIITTNKYIIVSYGVTKLDAGSILGNSQLVIFDHNGKVVFKYNSTENLTKINFLEVLCFLKQDEEILYFIALGLNSDEDFPIIKFNLNDFSSEVLFYLSQYDKTKSIYPRAFNKINGQWYFFENTMLDNENNSKCKIQIHTIKNISIENVFTQETIALLPIALFNMGFVYNTYFKLIELDLFNFL